MPAIGWMCGATDGYVYTCSCVYVCVPMMVVHDNHHHHHRTTRYPDILHTFVGSTIEKGFWLHQNKCAMPWYMCVLVVLSFAHLFAANFVCNLSIRKLT